MKKCIACGRETNWTCAKQGIEAAFCHYHYPLQKRIVLEIRCTI